MQRREFIKSSLCLSCAAAAGVLGCSCNKNSVSDELSNFDPKKSRFYYKSKEDLPRTVRMEACSLCQLDCPICTVRLLEKQAPKDWLGYLKFKNFKKFVDENDFIKKIELSNNGEIFLNPELDEIIKYAHSKNIVLTATNGVNLNTVSDKTLENLVKYKFKSLTIALDGATPETYKIYRRGGDFDTVIDNIKKINYFKEKYNSEFPKLTWQFIVFGHNEHEIELAKIKAKKLKMEIVYRKNSYNPNYSPIKDKKRIEKLTNLKLQNEDLVYLACRKIFNNNPQIDFNGNLLGCCFIRIQPFKANVFKDGLLNALNSPDYVYAQEMLSDFSKKPINSIPCANCIDYKYLISNNYQVFKESTRNNNML